jgi:hypothetical protein
MTTAKWVGRGSSPWPASASRRKHCASGSVFTRVRGRSGFGVVEDGKVVFLEALAHDFANSLTSLKTHPLRSLTL